MRDAAFSSDVHAFGRSRRDPSFADAVTCECHGLRGAEKGTGELMGGPTEESGRRGTLARILPGALLRWCCVVFIACTSGVVRGQNRPLTSGIELVTVDVIAVDRGGRPVEDLRAEELTLAIDGVARRISSFHLVKVPGSPVEAGARLTTPADVAVRVPRTIVIIFDHESIRPGNERLAKEGAARFVQSLSPDDRVAVVTMPHGGVSADLTTDRAAVGRALAAVAGHAAGTPDVCESVRLGIRTIEALRVFVEGLAAIDGLKTLVFVSEGIDARSQRCGSIRDYLRRLERTVASARVRLYAIQPHAPPDIGNGRTAGPVNRIGSSLGDARLAGLEDLVGVTGGDLFRPAAAMDQIFNQVLAETSAHYVVAFEPAPRERDGERHRIRLDTSRDGVTLKARPAFSLPSASQPRARNRQQ